MRSCCSTPTMTRKCRCVTSVNQNYSTGGQSRTSESNQLIQHFATFSREKSLIRHHFVLSYLFFYRPPKETTCPIGFLGQFCIRKVACPQSADGVLIMKNAFIDHTQIVKIKIHNYVPNKSCISESIQCVA